MENKNRGNLMLLITAMIWGVAFVAQSKGMDYIGPYTFNAVRNFIATLGLIPVIYFFYKKKLKISDYNKSNFNKSNSNNKESFYKCDKITIIGGLICGIILFIASSLQQIGIMYTTSGKAGFITTLYIVIVPILSIFLGKKSTLKIWICVLLAAVGFYLLSITEEFTIGKGDFLIFLCAVFYSFHILVIDYFSTKVDAIKMSSIQFFTTSVISTIAMFMFETPNIGAILMCTGPLLYTGLLSSGVGFTIQIIAQKRTNPTVASLIISLEAVFAVIAGVLILKEVLTSNEIIGCLIIFIATIIAQIPSRSKHK